jgi:probable rRNA maturation factor
VTVWARSEHPRGAAAARRLRERARRYLATLRQGEAELSILVVDDRAMLRLNRAWRGLASPTDVLSFPCHGPAAGPLLGDVVISLDTARRAARAAGRTLGGELDRYLAHGLLHLLGYDHHRPADARRMSAAEDALVGEGMVSAARRGKTSVTEREPDPVGRSRRPVDRAPGRSFAQVSGEREDRVVPSLEASRRTCDRPRAAGHGYRVRSTGSGSRSAPRSGSRAKRSTSRSPGGK